MVHYAPKKTFNNTSIINHLGINFIITGWRMCYAITTPLLMLWYFINFDEKPDKHKKEQVKTMYTRRISKQSKRSTKNMKKFSAGKYKNTN